MKSETSGHTYHEFICGGIANSISLIGLFPFYKTIFFQQLDGISWIEAAQRLRNEGFKMAYRGVLPPLLQRTSSCSIMFGIQGSIERALICDPMSSTISPNYTAKIISSVFAGCCEAVLLPFERIQTLLQNKEFHEHFKNTIHAITKVRSHGTIELYRGLTPVLIRNSLANCLYFSGYNWLNSNRVHRENEYFIEYTFWNFLFGGLLGGVIGVITFPLNVAKTRMQSKVGGQFDGLRSTFVALIFEDSAKPNISRLYRGVPANLMRSMLSWGLITMTYHILLSFHSGT